MTLSFFCLFSSDIDRILTVIGLSLSIAGYVYTIKSGEGHWLKSIWLPVIVALVILVVLQISQINQQHQTVKYLIASLERQHKQTINQLKLDLLLRNRSLDEIAQALELLLAKNRLHVEQTELRLPDGVRPSVELYSLIEDGE